MRCPCRKDARQALSRPRLSCWSVVSDRERKLLSQHYRCSCCCADAGFPFHDVSRAAKRSPGVVTGCLGQARLCRDCDPRICTKQVTTDQVSPRHKWSSRRKHELRNYLNGPNGLYVACSSRLACCPSIGGLSPSFGLGNQRNPRSRRGLWLPFEEGFP